MNQLRVTSNSDSELVKIVPSQTGKRNHNYDISSVVDQKWHNAFSHSDPAMSFITARIRRMREGNSFSRSTLAGGGRGTPS